MKSKRRWAVVLLVVVGAAVYGGKVLATPSIGVSQLYLAPITRFEEIDAKVKTGDWKASLQTKGASDLHVLQNTIVPGGTFGWHSHPGPSLVIVKSGTATFYLDGDACTPHVVPAGSGFMDQGGGDVHVVRNEGNVDLVTVVVSLVPAGATRRIDQDNPYPIGVCPN